MKKARRITALQIVTILVTSCLVAAMQDVHSVAVFVILVIATSATSAVLIAEVLERVPLFSKLTGFSKHVELISKGRWPRRPYERMTDWYNRVIEAHRELCDAEWAFVEAAQLEGHKITFARVEQWLLPPSHPAAIRLAKARNEPVVITKQAPYRGAVV